MTEGDGPEGSALPLMPFDGRPGDGEGALPFAFADYLELVDWSGRILREDKRGAIGAGVPPILLRLGVEPGHWIEVVRHFRRHFHDHVGPAAALERRGKALGRKWLRGVGACRRLWGPADGGRGMGRERLAGIA